MTVTIIWPLRRKPLCIMCEHVYNNSVLMIVVLADDSGLVVHRRRRHYIVVKQKVMITFLSSRWTDDERKMVYRTFTCAFNIYYNEIINDIKIIVLCGSAIISLQQANVRGAYMITKNYLMLRPHAKAQRLRNLYEI